MDRLYDSGRVYHSSLRSCRFLTQGRKMYKFNDIENLIEWLESFVDRGISLFLMGERVSPIQAAEAVMNMSGAFMADFVHDNAGCLREIRYDMVRYV